MDFNQVKVINHPLIQHKLTIMRKKETSTVKFRTLMHEVSMLLAYEVTRDLEIEYEEIETPLATMQSPVLKGKKLVFVSILRAGNGLLDGMLQLVPTARIGHIGLYRDPKTLEAVEYYFKLPDTRKTETLLLLTPCWPQEIQPLPRLKRSRHYIPSQLNFFVYWPRLKEFPIFMENILMSQYSPQP